MDQKDWSNLLNVAGPAGAIGFSVAVFRGVIEQRRGWRKWLGGLAASVLVGMTVGIGLQSQDVPFLMQYAIILPCAYVARDIVMALTSLSGMMAASPLSFLGKIREALKGGSNKEGGQ